MRDIERRRDGWVAAVGVGDEQRIRGEDRLQHVLHGVRVQRGQGMAVTGNVKLPDYGRSKFPHLERMGEVLAPL